MNKNILHTEIQEYICDNINKDINSVLLAKSPFKNVTSKEVAQQIFGLAKSEKKFPTFYSTSGIYYPPKLNIEQTSSEETARYKSQIPHGKTLCDITGGFGIDTYFFSKQFEQVTHIEQNEELATIAAHNFKALQATNIQGHHADGIEFLKTYPDRFDVIYIDPSRRVKSQKVFKLSDCEPNVPAEINLLFAKAAQILIKTSPLLDLTQGLRELEHVTTIYIVAVKNEVKEVLWLLEQNDKPDTITLHTTNSYPEITQTTQTDYYSALQAQARLSEPLTYLYEPNAALMKSGLFNWIGQHFDLPKLHPNTHLYTSDVLQDFPGRVFVIKNRHPFTNKLKKVLGNTQANVLTRNFKLTVSQLRQKFKILDGGDRFYIFTTTRSSEMWVLDCERLT